MNSFHVVGLLIEIYFRLSISAASALWGDGGLGIVLAGFITLLLNPCAAGRGDLSSH